MRYLSSKKITIGAGILLAIFLVVGVVLRWSEPEVQAADVAIDTNVSTTDTSFSGGSPTMVFIGGDNGYAFYRDSGGDCVYSKTTDGGVNWGGAVQVDSINTGDCIRIAVWYDQWTPGDSSGAYIHIATIDSGADDMYYTRLDTFDDSLSTTVRGGPAQSASLAAGTNHHSITKATDGALYMTVTDAADQWVVTCTTTCTTENNWTQITNPHDATNDWPILMPLAGGDIMIIRRDLSGNDYDYRTWDGANWSSGWTTIDASGGENTTYDMPFGATVDKGTNTIYLAFITDNGTLGTNDDVRTAVYNGTWTIKTDVLTDDSKGLTGARIALDANSGEIYVVYAGQTTPGTASTANIYYKKSTNGMTSWGSEIQLNDTADDIYGISVNILATHRIYVKWKRVSLDDLYGETVAVLAPPVLTQTAYRWFNNSDSTNVSSALATQDTPATAPDQGTPFRLRMLVRVASGSLDADSRFYKLQYAQRSGTCDTGFSGESYSDVASASGDVRLYDNATPGDGNALTANGNDPTDGGATIINQTYEEEGLFSANTLIEPGQDGKWDFALVDFSAPGSTSYCFRMVKADSNPIDNYLSIPQITTRTATTDTIVYVRSNGTTGTSTTLDIGSAGTNRLVVVMAGDESAGTNLTGATVDGNACTLVNRANNTDGLGNHSEMWYCDEDNLTTSNGTVNIAITGGDASWAVHAHLYTGVSQSGPSDNEIEQTQVGGTTISIENVTVPDDGVVVMMANHGNTGTWTGWTSPLTERTDGNYPSSAIMGTASGIESTAQTNKTYVATASAAMNRGTGVVGVWGPATLLSSDVTVGNIGTQVSTLDIPTDNQYVGGAFTLISNGSRNITGITISENGTVNGATGLASVSLFYDLDTSAPYNCVSETYGGSEAKFGVTDLDGFSGADGTSAFTGSVAVSATSTMCVYVVVDVLATAQNGETVEVEISDPSTQVTTSAGTIGPAAPVALSDTTALLAGVDLQQIHYRWRDDNGGESGFTAGTGADGSVSISTNRNINTAVLGSDRTTNADGILTTVSAFSAAASGTQVTVAASTGIVPTDEVFLINLQGDSTNNANVGNYEFLTVQNVAGTTITFTTPVRHIYGATTSNLVLTGQKIILQRVPQWSNVNINSGGKLVANAFNGTSGGVLVFRATGTVSVNSGGSIDATGLGYRGGSLDTVDTTDQASFRGESRGAGLDARTQSENLGAGGGGFVDTNNDASNCAGAAGGGGYGATGQAATQACGSARNGAGGSTYGVSDLTKIYFGGGGGTGGHDNNPSANSGGPGGSGGGIVFIAANEISVAGTVLSNGDNGTAGEGTIWIGGAGGAGGSVLLQTASISAGTDLVTAAGGLDGGNLSMSGYVSGDGGVGRIRIEADTILGSTVPVASTDSAPTFGGATWSVAEDSQLDNMTKNVTRRIRFEISNEGGQSASSTTYRLEVSGANPSTCAGATYTRLDTDTHWDTVTSTYFSDGDATTNMVAGLTDANPVFAAGSIKESNDQTAGVTLDGSSFTELEYAVQATASAVDGAFYCFRLTNAGATTNFTYFENRYARVSISGGPSISNFQLNGGDPISLVEGTVASISADGTVSDPNGYIDIIQATTAFSIFRSGVGYNCAANQNNCYRPVCEFSGCGGNSCSFSCLATIQFFAEPTDIGTYSAENWQARIAVWDTTGEFGVSTALGVELETLYAISMSLGSINYGTLESGQDTGSDNVSVTLTNTGNASLNPEISGTDMTGPGTLDVSEQKFSLTASFSYSGAGTALSNSAVPIGFTLIKPTSLTPISSTSYWGIGLPSSIPTGVYNGTNTFDAVP